MDESHRIVSCAGKIRYESPSAAAKARDRMKRKPNTNRDHNINMYRCQYCACWHLGRSSKAFRRPRD